MAEFDDEVEDLIAELAQADAEDGGEEADLPEGVPLPEKGEETVVTFIGKRGTRGPTDTKQ